MVIDSSIASLHVFCGRHHGSCLNHSMTFSCNLASAITIFPLPELDIRKLKLHLRSYQLFWTRIQEFIFSSSDKFLRAEVLSQFNLKGVDLNGYRILVQRCQPYLTSWLNLLPKITASFSHSYMALMGKTESRANTTKLNNQGNGNHLLCHFIGMYPTIVSS